MSKIKGYKLRQSGIPLLSVLVVLSLVIIYSGASVAEHSVAESQVVSTAIQGEVNSNLSVLGLHKGISMKNTIQKKGYTVKFIGTDLYSSDSGNSGYLVTAMVNNIVKGEVIESIVHSQNSTTYNIIPVYSSVLSHNLTSKISYQHSNNLASNTKSSTNSTVFQADSEVFPQGTYSSGWLGWAYSFNNYNTNGLIAWLVGVFTGSETITGAITLAIESGLTKATAIAILPVLAAAAGTIGLINWMGGYRGIYVAQSTSLMAPLMGHLPPPGIWLSYNPVPGGY